MLTCQPHAGSVIQRLCIMPKCFFLFILSQVCNNTSDRKHADTMLERYVTETVMSIVTCFFSSPFSDQSTSLQVIRTVDVACEVYITSSLTVGWICLRACDYTAVWSFIVKQQPPLTYCTCILSFAKLFRHVYVSNGDSSPHVVSQSLGV